MLTEIIAQRSIADFAEDVRNGLTKPGQKELASNYLYDEARLGTFRRNHTVTRIWIVSRRRTHIASTRG